MKKGVFQAVKKDGTIYYRSAVTYRGKRISLGGYDTEEKAHLAYAVASRVLMGETGGEEPEFLKKNAPALVKNTAPLDVDDYPDGIVLPFKKWVVLINFRDNGIYIKTPIYLRERFFYYYFAPEDYLTFDSDDLFYYSTHSIMRRGGHFFVADFGMQVNIRSRYGIKNFAVCGRDYEFVNGDETDFRSANIHIINTYHGVEKKRRGNRDIFETKIHIRGVYIVGRYPDESEAAIAYNKSVNILSDNGIKKNYTKNYIVEIGAEDYRKIYEKIQVSDAIKNFG